MRFGRLTWMLRVFCLAVLWHAAAGAQDLALTKDVESGFRRFIAMAESGQLGDGIINANVGVEKNRARVELVRAEAPLAVLFLTPKRSKQTISRYFDIEPGEGAKPSDAALVGKALDQVFQEDPFQLTHDYYAFPGDPIPSLTEAWAYGTWKSVVRAFERRMSALVSLRYTVAVIAALAVGFVASVIVLCVSVP